MILVTVGNATQPFRRLLMAVDELAGQGLFGTEVVFMQSGHAGYFRPKHASCEPFIGPERFVTLVGEARLVISHGGCGTLLQAVQAGKAPVAVPRRAALGEHVNDHQLQLVQALADEGLVVPALDVSALKEAITEAGRRHPKPLVAGPMVSLVRQAIEELLFL